MVESAPFSLIYLHHSGFALCFAHFTVLIDFYQDSVDETHGLLHDEILNRSGPLYVLCSHFHQDHFNPHIFTFSERKSPVRFVLSKDIYKKRRQWLPVDDIAFVSAGDVYTDDNLQITAFGSTDVGVSFFIEAQSLKIFHAGDLNNWHWQDESTPSEAAAAERMYLTELKKIAEKVPCLDIAMFPVDPRLGSDYMRGAMQFLQQIKTSFLVPMHFWEQPDKAAAAAQYSEEFGCRTLMPEHRGFVFSRTDWTADREAAAQVPNKEHA